MDLRYHRYPAQAGTHTVRKKCLPVNERLRPRKNEKLLQDLRKDYHLQ